MSYEHLRVERRDDAVVVVTLDRPPANALSVALLDELTDVSRSFVDDPPGAVVFAGGERFFAAGAEISEFGGPDEARAIGARFVALGDAIAAVPRVTIAAVSGYALGGGCELALCCDLRVAGSKARFGQPEILLGIIPGGGGTQRLPRLVGASRAKDLVLTGRQIDAAEAHRIGLVDRLAPEGTTALEAALELAGELARGPLVAHGLVKRAIDLGLDGPLATGLELEQDLFAHVFASEDARIGVASFLEHGPGKASFTGR